MKKLLLVLVVLGTVTPGVVVADDSQQGCQPAGLAGVANALGEALPLEDAGNATGGSRFEDTPGFIAPLPWGSFPENVADEPVENAIPGQAPLCPQQTFCTGSSCVESGPCSFITTGRRCCYDSGLNQVCCPAGMKVHRVVCPCVGTACDRPTRQTATCL